MKLKNTLLKKVIFIFIVLLLPFILLSSLVLNYSNQTLKNQILSSIDSNNTTYISQLDNTLYNIYATNFNIVNQSSLQTLSNIFSSLSPYEKGYRIRLLREQISGICISSPFIESAHVYFKDLKTVYNSNGYELGSFSSLTENTLELIEKAELSHGLLHYYQNPLNDNWELSYFLLPSSGSGYGANFVLSQKEIENYLQENMTYEGEHYLFTSSNHFSLTDFDPGLLDNILSVQNDLSITAYGLPYSALTIKDTDYYAFYYEMPHTSAAYVRFIPANALLQNIDMEPIILTVFLLLVSVSCIIFFIEMYHLIHKPLIQLTAAFTEVENGNLKAEITDFQSNDFAYLYHAFNNMTHKLDELIEKDYTQKLLLQKAELKQLQAQINPHFLYNSFFMLQRMIKMECMEDANEMANALGIYFRYLTRNSMEQVTLLQEYEHAKTYAYIQGLRFSGRIQIDFEEIPSDFNSLPVPKLILQPILENAFNYGLANKMSGGILEIHFSSTGNTLTIKIEENGEELTDEHLHLLDTKLESIRESSSNCEMSGILNIQRRLIVFSNCHDSLKVSRSHLGGLCVSITLKNNLEEVL